MYFVTNCFELLNETVLRIDKFYTVVKIVYEMTFRTVVLRRSECMRDK